MVHQISDIYHRAYSWKNLKLNQLSELYISMTIKTLGLSLIGIFIPIYLYKLGYGIDGVALFFMIMYSIRIITDNVAAVLIGYFGPKHLMVISHIFLILSLAMFWSLESLKWPLALVALTNALATGFFFMSYHIEFSKIQTARVAGREISNMFKAAKFASAIGPLVGGAIATFYGVQLTILLSMVLILLSAIPLSLSPEPVRKRQHISWSGFPWKAIKWDVISNSGLVFDQMATLYIWPLYVAIIFFSENTYLNVGLVTSLGLAVSFFIATTYGRLIDKNKGKDLLKVGIFGQSISHFVRLIISSSSGVYVFNFINDPVSVAVRMPYTKGFYGAASSHEGYRDAYIAVIMTVSNFLRASVFMVLYFASNAVSDSFAMRLIFVIAGASIWLVTLHRYKALK